MPQRKHSIQGSKSCNQILLKFEELTCSACGVLQESVKQSDILVAHDFDVPAGTESHFAMLTNDSFWRLYHVDDLTVAEQTFELQISPDRYVWLDNSFPGTATFCHTSAA